MMSAIQRTSLAKFLRNKRRTARRTTSSSEVGYPADAYPVGHFGPQYGLSPAQAWLAQRLLSRANGRRPLRGSGRSVRFRQALRIAGIVSAVKRGVVGNSRWGRSMLARRGGRVLALHAPDHLRRISRMGVRAKRFKRLSREEQIAFAVAEVERMRRQGAQSV